MSQRTIQGIYIQPALSENNDTLTTLYNKDVSAVKIITNDSLNSSPLSPKSSSPPPQSHTNNEDTQISAQNSFTNNLLSDISNNSEIEETEFTHRQSDPGFFPTSKPNKPKTQVEFLGKSMSHRATKIGGDTSPPESDLPLPQSTEESTSRNHSKSLDSSQSPKSSHSERKPRLPPNHTSSGGPRGGGSGGGALTKSQPQHFFKSNPNNPNSPHMQQAPPRVQVVPLKPSSQSSPSRPLPSAPNASNNPPSTTNNNNNNTEVQLPAVENVENDVEVLQIAPPPFQPPKKELPLPPSSHITSSSTSPHPPKPLPKPQSVQSPHSPSSSTPPTRPQVPPRGGGGGGYNLAHQMSPPGNQHMQPQNRQLNQQRGGGRGANQHNPHMNNNIMTNNIMTNNSNNNINNMNNKSKSNPNIQRNKNNNHPNPHPMVMKRGGPPIPGGGPPPIPARGNTTENPHQQSNNNNSSSGSQQQGGIQGGDKGGESRRYTNRAMLARDLSIAIQNSKLQKQDPGLYKFIEQKMDPLDFATPEEFENYVQGLTDRDNDRDCNNSGDVGDGDQEDDEDVGCGVEEMPGTHPPHHHHRQHSSDGNNNSSVNKNNDMNNNFNVDNGDNIEEEDQESGYYNEEGNKDSYGYQSTYYNNNNNNKEISADSSILKVNNININIVREYTSKGDKEINDMINEIEELKMIQYFNAHADRGAEKIFLKIITEKNATSSNPISPKSVPEFEKAVLIAYYLHSNTSQTSTSTKSQIDKETLGNYLGDGRRLQSLVRDAFLDFIDFSDLEFDMAIRRFLHWFRLPGEAQKIDRLLESFAKKYFHHQTSCSDDHQLFINEDAVYILSFSTIMLNTDIHNTSVKKKMTMVEFIAQNRGVNGGSDFDPEFLQDLYHAILEDEIRDIDDFNVSLKKGWLLVKQNNATLWKRRWVIVTPNSICFFKHQVLNNSDLKDALVCIESSQLIVFSSDGSNPANKKLIPRRFLLQTVAGDSFRITARSNREQLSWLRVMNICKNSTRN